MCGVAKSPHNTCGALASLGVTKLHERLPLSTLHEAAKFYESVSFEAQLRDRTAELDLMRSGAGGARRNLALAPI